MRDHACQGGDSPRNGCITLPGCPVKRLEPAEVIPPDGVFALQVPRERAITHKHYLRFPVYPMA